MYLVQTRNRLCKSKKYFEERADMMPHLKEVIKQSKEYWKITQEDIKDGVTIISIDVDELPNWKVLFGPELPIREPHKYNKENDDVEDV